MCPGYTLGVFTDKSQSRACAISAIHIANRATEGLEIRLRQMPFAL